MMMRMMMTVSALALTAGVAAAATEVTTAGERVAGAHAPMGVRAGSFLVIPKVDLEVSHNDNLYATQSNEKSAMTTTVRPEVQVRSNWSRHALNAMARYEMNHSTKSAENTNNYSAAVDGRADVMRDTSIGAGVAYARDHEDRGNPNTIGSPVKPTEYETMTAKAGAYRGLGKLNARFDTEAKDFSFKNGYTSAGALLNTKVRDRTEYANTLRFGYQIDPRFEVFVRGTADTRAYDRKGGGANTLRSNHGRTLVAGSTFDITGKTKGEVYVGHVKRDYVTAALKDISEVTYGAKATWNASQLTSLIASIDRGVEETTLAGSSGFVATDYKLRAEHALKRNVLLYADAGYAHNDYKGFAANQRKDKIWTAGAGADYYFNRCLKAGLGYDYTSRDSNVVNGDFDRNAVMLKLTATY